MILPACSAACLQLLTALAVWSCYHNLRTHVPYLGHIVDQHNVNVGTVVPQHPVPILAKQSCNEAHK